MADADVQVVGTSPIATRPHSLSNAHVELYITCPSLSLAAAQASPTAIPLDFPASSMQAGTVLLSAPPVAIGQAAESAQGWRAKAWAAKPRHDKKQEFGSPIDSKSTNNPLAACFIYHDILVSTSAVL